MTFATADETLVGGVSIRSDRLYPVCVSFLFLFIWSLIQNFNHILHPPTFCSNWTFYRGLPLVTNLRSLFRYWKNVGSCGTFSTWERLQKKLCALVWTWNRPAYVRVCLWELSDRSPLLKKKCAHLSEREIEPCLCFWYLCSSPELKFVFGKCQIEAPSVSWTDFFPWWSPLTILDDMPWYFLSVFFFCCLLTAFQCLKLLDQTHSQT